ncbi:MAG: DNA-formamidopyrimidine glycosylase [Candidatus Nealsonbacteria bacterium]|nr:DNA-formamidopyrimidine glycosylase [Candidatus Nealsonbacteria bacterium]
MPELPEVETTVRDLRKKVLSRTFIDVWTDFEKMIKNPKSFPEFKKEIINKKILNVKRRAKFILFELSDDKILLIHQKLTGHLLLGKWQKQKTGWKSFKKDFLSEKINSYIHLLFKLDNGEMLALSDLRKFARIELWGADELFNLQEFKSLGPEPLEKSFTFEKFKEILKNKKTAKGEPRQRRGKVKQVLMDPNVIAGIGNIYSDEILFQAKIHPFRLIPSLKEKELERIYQNIIKILEKGIELKGESFSDWRTIEGKKGFFDDYRRVYQREGEKCSCCKSLILRKKIGGRSAHFCPNCQKL